MISYISVLCFVPMLAQSKDADVQFHMKQGIALFIIEVVAFILKITIVFAWLSLLIDFVCLLASLYGMWNAYNKKQVVIPGLSFITSMLKM